MKPATIWTTGRCCPDHDSERLGRVASHAVYEGELRGGRYNPIAVVDRADAAKRIVEVFRADVISSALRRAGPL
jgi:hypothetical protein